MNRITHDVLIIGAGLAGMRAALEVPPDLDVALISKVHPLRSHSVAAEGGINAAMGEDDSWEAHALDTVKGSDYLGDQDAIEILCQEGPPEIRHLDRLGALFSRDPQDRIAQRPFGGADYPRTCFTADRTGHSLVHLLYEQVLKRRIRIYEEWYVTSLIVEDHQCQGAIALNLRTGTLHVLAARAVILATGGYGRVYSISTNALINTGDGMSMAYQAGAPLMDMEFVQFHPTTLKRTGILLSEAARGEGGFLINARGERFMQRYAPKKQELASRDVVSRAEQQEIDEGRGLDGCVLLDVRHLGRRRILERLPQIRELALTYIGVDMIESPVPIVPGVHYSMGGIKTDLWGETNIRGLFAAGECACVSVHGANRLGGNALLETIVFGKRAGARAAQVRTTGAPEAEAAAWRRDRDRIQEILQRDSGESVWEIHEALGETMARRVGIFRTPQKLQPAREEIRQLQTRYREVTLQDRGRIFNTELTAALELESLLGLGAAIVESALYREESRGAHYRLDYPKRNDDRWLTHTLVHASEDGPRISSHPVTITRFAPDKREY